LNVRHFSSGAEAIAAAETWLDKQFPELILIGLQKFRVWSPKLDSFLVGLRTYQPPGIKWQVNVVVQRYYPHLEGHTGISAGLPLYTAIY